MSIDNAGWCPTCYQREGPLHAFGLLYFYCLTHRYRWTIGARWRQTDPTALQHVREVCQKTTLILYAKTQRPDQQGLTRPSGLDERKNEEATS